MNNTMYHLYFRRLRRSINRLLPGIIFAAAFSSCEKTGFSYDNVVDNQQTDYILSDTLSVVMKTIRYDSVATSGAGVVLAGIKSDPVFGTTTASSFFRIAQPSGVNIPTYGSQYDSMRLIMRTNGYSTGDTTAPQELRIYRVVQPIQTAKGYYNLYNNSTFTTEINPIGSFTGIIRPNTDKVISVKMSDVLGNQLFTMLRAKNQEILTIDAFVDFFKGLQVRPGTNSKAITGFLAQDTTLYMRLYYHTNEIITTVKYLDFQLNAGNLQFNKVSADRTGTPLEALTGPIKELPSEKSGNVSYTQPITGLATRIDIPYLKNLSQLGQYFKIMKVVMTITPAKGSVTKDSRLPPNLALCEINKANEVTDTLSYGSLTVDNLYNENTHYTYDITNYCNAQLTASGATVRGLMLTPSSGEGKTTLERMAINDQHITKNKIKIQLYYLLYK